VDEPHFLKIKDVIQHFHIFPQVAPSDKVCPMCRINVKNFYDFRIMCVQSDARIKGFAAKMAATPENLTVIKSDQVVRSYKRIRRIGEGDRPAASLPDPVGTVELFRSTADLFKSKAESSAGGGLFKLKTTPVYMRSEEAFKGLKRPLILSQSLPLCLKNLRQAEKPKKPKITADPLKNDVLASQDPLLTIEQPLSAGDPSSPRSETVLTSDPLSSDRDPLSSAIDPLSSVSDPLSSASDPLSSAPHFLSPEVDPFCADEETHNITVEVSLISGLTGLIH